MRSSFDILIQSTAFRSRSFATLNQVSEALPQMMHVQPKHDGTCIYAVCYDKKRYVSTYLSATNKHTDRANHLLQDACWTDGTTLGFELIWKDDPILKVQTRRVNDGLYLFYGVTKNGLEMFLVSCCVVVRNEVFWIAPGCLHENFFFVGEFLSVKCRRGQRLFNYSGLRLAVAIFGRFLRHLNINLYFLYFFQSSNGLLATFVCICEQKFLCNALPDRPATSVDRAA